MLYGGDATLPLCRLIPPLTIVTIFAMAACEARAQSAPAVQPPAQAGQTNDSAFPPVSKPPATNLGTSPVDRFQAPTVIAECMKEFGPLREEAERRGRLIKDAADRHAGPVEACKLIDSYAQAEVKMISFVESHATACVIPASITDTLKNGHKNTEALQTKVCNLAQQMQRKGPPAGPVGDFDLYR
jgi:hypothetical protein